MSENAYPICTNEAIYFSCAEMRSMVRLPSNKWLRLEKSISPYFEMLHLEILKCNNLRNMDAGEAMEIILIPSRVLHLKILYSSYSETCLRERDMSERDSFIYYFANIKHWFKWRVYDSNSFCKRNCLNRSSISGGMLCDPYRTFLSSEEFIILDLRMVNVNGLFKPLFT